MKFGELLKNSIYPPFAEGYLRYDALKKAIKAIATSSPANSPKPPQEKFGEVLIAEVRRIDEYATRLKQRYAARLEELERKWRDVKSWKQSNFPNVDQHVRKLHLEYLEVIEELDHLIDFIQLNIVGVQKIIKKHDRLTGEMTGPLLMAKLQRGSTGGGNSAAAGGIGVKKTKGALTTDKQKTTDDVDVRNADNRTEARDAEEEEEDRRGARRNNNNNNNNMTTMGKDQTGGYLNHLSDVASVAVLVNRAREGIKDVAAVLTGKGASSAQQDQQEFHDKWKNFDTFARPVETDSASRALEGGETGERARLLNKSASDGRITGNNLTSIVGSTNTLFLQQQQRRLLAEREAEHGTTRLERFLDDVARPMLVVAAASPDSFRTTESLGVVSPRSPSVHPTSVSLPLISLAGACLSGVGLGVIYATLQAYGSTRSWPPLPDSPPNGNQDTLVYVAVLLSLSLGGMTSRSYENSETFALLLAGMGAVSASIVALSSTTNFPVVLLASWMYGVCARAWSGTVPREFVTGSSRLVVAATSVMPSFGTLLGALLTTSVGRNLSVTVVAVAWCVVIVIMSAAEQPSSTSLQGSGLGLHSTPSSFSSTTSSVARLDTHEGEREASERQQGDDDDDDEASEDDSEAGEEIDPENGTARALNMGAGDKSSATVHSRWRSASFSASSWITLSSLFLLRWTRAIVLYACLVWVEPLDPRPLSGTFPSLAFVSLLGAVLATRTPSWVASSLALACLAFAPGSLLSLAPWLFMETAYRARLAQVPTRAASSSDTVAATGDLFGCLTLLAVASSSPGNVAESEVVSSVSYTCSTLLLFEVLGKFVFGGD